MDNVLMQQARKWLHWHVKDKRNQYAESQDLGTEEHLTMLWPSPPQSLLEYISEIEEKSVSAKHVLARFDTFAKMTAANEGTEREREEHLSSALEAFAYLIEKYPDMHPETDDKEPIDWY